MFSEIVVGRSEKVLQESRRIRISYKH